MGRRRRGKTRAKAAAAASPNRVWWILGAVGLVAAFGVAAWLRFYRLGDAVRGFHAYDEGYYLNYSLDYARRGFLSWVAKPGDLNNPPLFDVFVSWFFRAFGPSVLAARLVSALAGVATIALVYELGRLLYSRRMGVLSALIFALMPGSVLVSRNAQVDPLQVALALGAVVCWVHASDAEDGTWWGLAGGVLLGLGLVTKLPAVLVVPGLVVFEAIRVRGLGWLRRRRTWAFIGGAAVIPASWYAVRAIVDKGSFATSQATRFGLSELPSPAALWRVFGIEAFWMLGAVVVCLLAVGVVAMSRERTDGDALIATELLTAAVFVFFFHYHIYYWLPATPFFALVAGRGLDFIASWSRQTFAAVAVATACLLALSSAVMLAGHKWSDWSTKELQTVVGERSDGVVILADQMLWDNAMGPAMQFYLPEWAYVAPGQGVPKTAKRVIHLRPMGPDDPEEIAVRQTRWRLVLFGVAIAQQPPRINIFENGPWTAERVAPAWRFGLIADDQPGNVTLQDVTASTLGSEQ